MANIKFSAFTTETNSTDVDFLVGYQGTTMKKIAPSNLGGSYPFLIDSASLYSGFVPTGLTAGVQGNTFLGINAGSGGSNMTSCTYIGNFAGTGSTICTENTFVGKNAGYFNSNKNRNTYIGFDAGYLRGNQNVAIGHSAFDAFVATVDDSVAIGFQAGQAVTNAAGSLVLIGRDAGRTTQSVGHVAVGYNAGYSNTTGANNTNIGYQAAFSNTSNSNRTIIGYQAGQYTTGASNTFVGRYAGRGASGASAGERNTSLGDNALGSIRAGVRNVAVGNGAGQDVQAGDRNTMLGTFAGSNLTSGDYNIIIGNDAQASSSTVNGEITIGDTNVTSLRLPGLQSGASDGDVLTFSSGTGLITLAAAGGGGGASSLNGLSDCLVDTDSVYVAEVPSSLSGNPQGNTVLGIDAGNALTTGTNNTLIGNDAGLNLTTHSNTTAVGYQAGKSQNAESNNTYIGRQAGRDHIGSQSVFLGAQNRVYNNGKNSNGVTAIGYSAHDVNGGNFSTAIGYNTGNAATGDSGTYVGRNAGRVNTASSHVSVGHDAGYSQTSGQQNTNFGYSAGYSITTQQSNTMIGYEAGKSNTGSNNVFLGRAAGKGSGSGSQTIAIGQGVQELGSAANNSVFIGNFMAATTTSGANSTVAIGANCLAVGGYSAEGNTVVGYQAGNNLSSGDNNTLLGRNAGDALTTGLQNVVIGSEACEVGTGIINYNVTIGYRANENSGSGHNYDSVAIGQGAGQFTAAEGNVIIGYNAQVSSLTGGFNTIIGKQAKVGNTGSTGTNNLVLGYQAQSSASNISNEITLGNSSITSLRCAVTSITSLSDERDKSEIKDLEYGLAFIDALQPREFVWDNRPETKLIKDIENGTETEVEFYSANKGKKDFGFIAQEVRELDNDTLRLVYTENEDKLEMSYGKLVPILVKAIQDLSAKVTALENA